MKKIVQKAYPTPSKPVIKGTWEPSEVEVIDDNDDNNDNKYNNDNNKKCYKDDEEKKNEFQYYPSYDYKKFYRDGEYGGKITGTIID